MILIYFGTTKGADNMTINTENLKTELDKLNNLISDYEKNALSMYNEFKNAEDFWHDNNSKIFFDGIQKEKTDTQKIFTEFTELQGIYKFIVDSYEKFGKSITVELENKELVLNDIKKYIDRIDKIIVMYKNLNAKDLVEVTSTLDIQEKKIFKMKNDANKLYTTASDFYSSIERINKEIDLRLSKLTIANLSDDSNI